MRTRRILRTARPLLPLALLLVTLTLLTACGSSSTDSAGNGNTPAAGATNTPGGSGGGATSQTYASCKLASTQEVASATGLPIVNAIQAANICLYTESDNVTGVTAAVSPYSDINRAKQVASDICSLGQPIAGLGDKACSLTNPGGAIADVLRGPYLLAVTVPPGEGISDMAGVAVKLAQLMTPRLQ
jgi:hypothetical protein